MDKYFVENGIINFGKYAGKRVAEAPTEYLIWFCQNVYEQMCERRGWAVEELKSRGVQIMDKKKK